MTRARALVVMSMVAAVLSVPAMTVSGVPLLTCALLVIAVVWQGVCGVVIWRRLRPASSALEFLGMGLALGTFLAALAGTASATLHAGPWGWALPSILACAWWAWQRVRQAAGQHVERRVTGDDRWTLLGFAAAIVPGLLLWAYALRLYPLTWTGSWEGYHPDMPFFEALGNSLARHGAFASPFLPEASVRYHWLAYAWQGQLEVSTQAAPFVVLTRTLPLVALLGCAAITATWARRLTSRRWVPALAGLLLAIGGFTGAVFGGVLTMDSPSQSLSVLWLFAFAVVITEGVIQSSRRRRWLVLAAVIAFGLMGAKVSAGAPAVAGVLAVAIGLQIVRSKSSRQAWQLVVATAIGAGAGFAFFLAGASGGGGLTLGSLIDRSSSQQGLNPMDGSLGVVLGTVVLAVSVLPRWAGLGWLLTIPSWRRNPVVLLGLGMGLSSLLALLAFNSFNEVWFSSTVSGPLAVVTAVGAGEALGALRTRPRPGKSVLLGGALVTGAVGFAVVWALWGTGASGGNLFVHTLRWLAPLAAILWASAAGLVLAQWGTGQLRVRSAVAGAVLVLVVLAVPGRLLGLGTGQVGVLQHGIRDEWFSVGSAPHTVDEAIRGDWSQDELEAATWLRDHSTPTDLVATNLVYGPLVPGLTDRPTFASGAIYQIPYGRYRVKAVMLGNERLVQALVEARNASSAAPLCAAGVRWLWLSPRVATTDDWSAVATVERSWPAVSLLRLLCS